MASLVPDMEKYDFILPLGALHAFHIQQLPFHRTVLPALDKWALAGAGPVSKSRRLAGCPCPCKASAVDGNGAASSRRALQSGCAHETGSEYACFQVRNSSASWATKSSAIFVLLLKDYT